MAAKRPSPSFSLKRFGAFLSVVCMSILALGAFTPAFAAPFTPGAPITIVSNSGHQELTAWSASCTIANFYYVFYVDSTAPPTVFGVVSPDGINWGAPLSIQVLTSIPNTGFTVVSQAAISCTNNGSSGQLAIAWTDNSAGAGKLHVDYTICPLAAGTIGVCPAFTQGPISSNGHLINLATGSGVFSIRQLSGTTLYGVSNSGVGREVVVNNVEKLNTTNLALGFDFAVASAGGLTVMVAAGAGSSNTNLQYAYSTNSGGTWTTAVLNSANGGNIAFGNAPSGSFTTGGGSGMVGIGGVVWIAYMESHSGGNCATTNCIEVGQINLSGGLTVVTIGDATGGSINPILITSDGGQNIIMISHPGSSAAAVMAQSSNGGSTWTISTFTGQGGISGSIYNEMVSGIYSTTTNSFVVTSANTAAPFNVYVQVFSISPSSAVSQTQTIGNCPTKNTATFTPVNNTLYFYYGTSVGTSSVSTITVGISSVGGATGTHTIGLYIYAATQPGAISASNNLYQAFAFTKALTSGTGHSVLTVQVSGSLIPQGVQWGVGVVADNKINLNQSGLTGIYTQAGVASNAVQSNFFTTQGTSVGTELYLCATASFQSSTTTTITSTTTTTSTQSATGSAGQASASNLGNLLLGVIVIIGPAMLMAGATKQLWGAMLGAALGTAAGTFAGILPFYVIIVVVLAIIAVLFLGRNTGGGQGGGI